MCFSIAKLFFAYGIGNSMFFPLSVGASAVLEPAITMGLGVVMALIMWSVLSPVYDIVGKLKL